MPSLSPSKKKGYTDWHMSVMLVSQYVGLPQLVQLWIPQEGFYPLALIHSVWEHRNVLFLNFIRIVILCVSYTIPFG